MSDISPEEAAAIAKKYWRVLMLTCQKIEEQPEVTIGAAFHLAKTEAGFDEIPEHIENIILGAAAKCVANGGAAAIVTAVRSAMADGKTPLEAARMLKGEEK